MKLKGRISYLPSGPENGAGAGALTPEVDRLLGAVQFDQEDLMRRFRERYREMMGENVPFLALLKEDLDRVVSRDFREFSFPLSLWVKVVYLSINAFSRLHDPKVLDALRVLWQGRFLSLVRETQEMNDDEAERHIREQLDAFQPQRSILSI